MFPRQCYIITKIFRVRVRVRVRVRARVRVRVRVGILYESVPVAKCPNHVIRARVRFSLKILIYLTFQLGLVKNLYL